MAAHGLTASETLGIRAEMDAPEVCAEFASRASNPFFQDKIELLAREELEHKCIVEETDLPPHRLELPLPERFLTSRKRSFLF